MELKKGQKQGRDERTQEDYRTSAVCFCRSTELKKDRNKAEMKERKKTTRHLLRKKTTGHLLRKKTTGHLLRKKTTGHLLRKKTTGHLLCIFSRCPVVFLRSFISGLFLSFFQLCRSLSLIKFHRKFFPLVKYVHVPARWVYSAFLR